jgi:hypothetical protein
MKAIIALALIGVTASPALAERRINRAPEQHLGPQQGPNAAAPYDRRQHSATPQWDIYRPDGSYAGTDPDPNVRRNLFRDNPFSDD